MPSKTMAMSLLLRPSNILEGAKPLFRTLNPITDIHHRALDYILPTLTNKSIFYPHGAPQIAVPLRAGHTY